MLENVLKMVLIKDMYVHVAEEKKEHIKNIYFHIQN